MIDFLFSVYRETMHGAMDQHAMNMAVPFAEWVQANGYYRVDNEWMMPVDCNMEYVCDTTEQLYKIFLNQLQ